MEKTLNYSRLVIFSILLTITFASCTKNFDNINTPENLLSDDKINGATVGQAFGYAQYYGLGARWVQVQENLHAHIYTQYFTSNGANFGTERYTPNDSWVSLFWKEFYSMGALMQFTTEQVTEANDMAVANAIAKIWRVEIYHRMTDYFGPIIYSQFGNQKTSVAYDSQQDVYNDFFITLDEAVDVLKTNPTGYAFGTNDQVFKGNTAQWLKFANSLGYALIGSDNADLSRIDLARRVIYPPSEVTTNSEAYKAALGLLGGPDGMQTRLWWDKNPLSDYPTPTN